MTFPKCRSKIIWRIPTHDAITLGVPVLVILFGILFNRHGLNDLKAENKQGLNELKADLKAEMIAMETRLEARIAGLDARVAGVERDMKDFYRIQAEHDVKIDALREKR